MCCTAGAWGLPLRLLPEWLCDCYYNCNCVVLQATQIPPFPDLTPVFPKSVVSGIRDVITTTMRRIYEHLAAAKLGRCVSTCASHVCWHACWLQGRSGCRLQVHDIQTCNMHVYCHKRCAVTPALTSPCVLPL